MFRSFYFRQPLSEPLSVCVGPPHAIKVTPLPNKRDHRISINIPLWQQSDSRDLCWKAKKQAAFQQKHFSEVKSCLHAASLTDLWALLLPAVAEARGCSRRLPPSRDKGRHGREA